MRKTVKIKKILVHVFWSLFGAGVVVLLAAAVRAKQDKECSAIEITFTGQGSPLFLNTNEVMNILTGNGRNVLKGEVLRAFDLQKLEAKLEQKIYVADAEIYFNNQQVLEVKVRERIPVARVFTSEGNSFFLDSSGRKLPLQHRSAIRLPVFTGYPYQAQQATRQEQPLLRDILEISKHLSKDSFLLALVSTVDHVGKGQFELTPLVGDLVIEWGDGSDAAEKCARLKKFYESVMSNSGLDHYSRIKVQYKGQVIAVREEEKNKKPDDRSATQKIKEVIEQLQQEQQLQAERATQSVIEEAMQQEKREPAAPVKSGKKI